MKKNNMSALKYLILHCTATSEGVPFSAQQIKNMHMAPPPKGKGWDRPGYASLILLDGTVHRFRLFDEDQIVEAHELTYGAGEMNAVSAHFCYVGGLTKDGKKPKDTLTTIQFEALKKEILIFIDKHPQVKIAGHYNFANKACPSFNVPDKMRLMGIPEKNIYIK